MRRPVVACLVPVWNEAWILERFLEQASRWADRIVVADQGSTDGSFEIARRHPKVMLADDVSPTGGDDDALDVFRAHRRARQQLLHAARELPSPRVLVALDADEALTADAWTTAEWSDAVAAPPGTAIRMPWINLLPGCRRAWVPREPIAFGLVDADDGEVGDLLPAQRLPIRSGAPTLDLGTVGVLHFQYLDQPRMRAKQRWYQCLERVEYPDKRPAEIYRQYHHMDAWPSDEMHPVDPASIGDVAPVVVDGGGSIDQWHRRVLELMRDHRPDAFRRVDIWDVDWESEARRLRVDAEAVPSPSALDRLVLRYLRYAQPRRRSPAVRGVSRALRALGW